MRRQTVDWEKICATDMTHIRKMNICTSLTNQLANANTKIGTNKYEKAIYRKEIQTANIPMKNIL